VRYLLARHPPWRQLVIISVVLPLLIVLAALAFAWPAARIAPRDLPVGIVGTGPASQQAVTALTARQPGGFNFRLYASQAAAKSAIENRDVYGAFDITASQVTVLEGSAASPAVARLLSADAQELARRAPRADSDRGRRLSSIPVKSVDLIATSAGDPNGMVLSSVLLPLTICSIFIAAAIALLVGFRPAWRQLIALTVTSAAAGLGAYLIGQGFLGALPGEPAATWAALSLTLLAMSAPTAGLIALIGPAGLGLSSMLMVYIGNPFSGATSAPQLLPGPVDYIGQWLPPGAGANLLRSTAYFSGNGAGGHLIVLIAWTVLGLAAIIVGHHAPIRFAAAARPAREPAHAAPAGYTAESDQPGFVPQAAAHHALVREPGR
jgi:hypothetical protein